MAGDPTNPRIWLGGDFYVGPVGTTAPTDITTALNAAFVALGLLSEDGLTETRDHDTTDYFAWGGIHWRTVKSKYKRTIKITALESNAVVMGLVDPGSVVATASGVTTRTVKVPIADPRAFVGVTTDGAVTSRLVIPKGEVVGVSDVTRAETDPTMYELTIVVYPDSAKVLYKELTNDPAAVAS